MLSISIVRLIIKYLEINKLNFDSLRLVRFIIIPPPFNSDTNLSKSNSENKPNIMNCWKESEDVCLWFFLFVPSHLYFISFFFVRNARNCVNATLWSEQRESLLFICLFQNIMWIALSLFTIPQHNIMMLAPLTPSRYWKEITNSYSKGDNLWAHKNI